MHEESIIELTDQTEINVCDWVGVLSAYRIKSNYHCISVSLQCLKLGAILFQNSSSEI